MISISLSQIEPDTIAEFDYYSSKNELLIAKGVKITEKNIATLKRRNIFDLYFQSSEDDEIHEALSKEFWHFSDEILYETHEREEPINLSEIQFGKKGLDQLLKSKTVQKLDEKFSSSQWQGIPTGKPFKDNATQKPIDERTEEYVNQISDLYSELLHETRSILLKLKSGTTGAATIRGVFRIVDQIAEILLTDEIILLNVAGSQSRETEYIFNHSLNVCILSLCIASSYGYNKRQLTEIGAGALLHDLGMLFIPEEIRFKKGKYNSDDLYEIQKHPILGINLAETLPDMPEPSKYIVYQVHERNNSKGYPKQRSGRFIHQFAKLVQIADIYEALSSPRPHRQANPPYKSIEQLVKMTRLNLLSVEFVKPFINDMSLFSIGGLVMLSNGCIAKVVGSNRHSTGKPVVRVLTDKEGKLLPKKETCRINLRSDMGAYITKALPGNQLADISIMDGFY